MIIIEKDVKKNVLTVKALSGGVSFTLGTYDLNVFDHFPNTDMDHIYNKGHWEKHKSAKVYVKGDKIAYYNVDAYMEV